jgi:glycosyltransferase involved in cell wall biosynthesis
MELSPHPPKLLPQYFRQAPVPALPGPIPRDARVRHIALIGNHLPRRCGIATYTTHVAKAVAERYPDMRIDVWAMEEPGKLHAYPETLAGTICQDEPASYLDAARKITACGADMVWIQHEFGIFGGRAGDFILSLIDRMTVPVAVAMHTVLADPDRDQRRVTLALIERCETIIVMAEAARRVLIERYGADPDQVIVIPHGIPDRPFDGTAPMKARLGLAGHDVILTFGLLSQGKGIETVIAAMPDVVRRNPKALYVVLGATHPHAIAWHGEAYRESLQALAVELGVAGNVRFIDAFVEQEELLDYLAAADIYATPYLNPAQVTSGTLSYAVGLGKPIVSTPYVHARELLGSQYGRLVDFGDSAGYASAINTLLADREGTEALRKRVYELGRTMIWPRLAEASLERFEAVAARGRSQPLPIRPPAIPRELGLAAIERMCDATGMLQHAIFDVPDRAHGYCIDDNARALMLACRDSRMAPNWLPVYAAFVEHAWNPETRRFRNFMNFDRGWKEHAGSEDSCGRAVWALGFTAVNAPEASYRTWARKLYERVIEPLSHLRSPRAQAFMMIGTAALAEDDPADPLPARLLARWGDGLLGLWNEYRQLGWDWFEPVLAYDNARLPEALIRAGLAIGREDFVERGLACLAWLAGQQTTAEGHFRAVGSDSFGRLYAPPLPFDQQPVEAWAMVDACDAAFDATGDAQWQERARHAYLWFLGRNELGLALGDPDSGECHDGLIPTGLNRNRGAESILAFYLATSAIQHHRSTAC